MPVINGKRNTVNRTAVERVNSRLDVSFGFENHTIRGIIVVLACHEEEKIPYDVVRDFDHGWGDLSVSPQFKCENVEEKCIRNTIKDFVARNTNYRMFSYHDKGPVGFAGFSY